MSGADRRKEVRYVVVGIEALLNGTPWPIIDISRSAVRLLKPAGAPVNASAEIVFRLNAIGRGRARSYPVAASLIRATDLELIYGYPLPCTRWEERLRARDTFLQTRLTAL